MRIIFVLFLFLVVNLPFFAQLSPANNSLDEGLTLVRKMEYKPAINKFKRAANIFRNQNKLNLQTTALLELAKTYLLADENYEAKKLAKTILQIIPSNDTLAASALQLLGNIAMIDSHFKKALRHFQKALSIREQRLPKNHSAIAESLLSIGITQNQLGRMDLAFQNIYDALQINQTTFGDSHPVTAEALGAFGMIYFTRGEYDYAAKLIQESIDVFKKSHQDSTVLLRPLVFAQQYFYLGKTYMAKGNYELGLLNIKRGLTIIEGVKGKEHPARAPFLNEIGKIYTLQGDYISARNFYQQALDLVEFHRGAQHPDISESYNNIAESFRAQGKLDSTLIFFKKSLTLHRSIFGDAHPKVAQSLSDLGVTFFELEKYDKALAYFNNAFTIFKGFPELRHLTIAKVEQRIGAVYLKKGGLETALQHFQNALNANVIPDFETLDVSKNPSLQSVLDKNIFLSTLALKAQTLTTLFLTKGKRSNLELSFESFLLCDTLIDEIRQSFIQRSDQLIFNQTASQVYEEAIFTCLILKNKTEEKKYIEQAFYFSEKSKANTLLQSLTNNEALRFADLPDSLENKEIQLKRNVALFQKQLIHALKSKDSLSTITSQQQLLEAKAAYNQFVIDLENNFQKYYQLKYDKSAASLQQVQNIMDKTSTLIEFMSGKKRLFIFSISKKEAFLDLIPKPEDYHNLIFDFRKSVTNREYITHPDSTLHAWQNYTSNAFRLYEILLKKPLNHFSKESFQKIIIVPDGILGYVPFGILLKEKPKSEDINYASLDYLLHDYSVSYAFSGSTLLKQQEVDLTTKPLKYGGFAPSYGSGKLSFASSSDYQYFKKGEYIDLPASRKGVKYIAEMLKGEAFVEEEATESRFRDTSHYFDILHLVMHGIYDDKSPLNSHLVFSQIDESTEDNFLTAAELYNMNIDALLVFLGSCNSGYGKINRGEGIMSVSRAFAYAGCPSIVMSLWNLPDEESANISTHFFQYLKDGDSKDEALQKAKLQYLNDANISPNLQHPFFWAGFVPIGDMTPLYVSAGISLWVKVLGVAVFLGLIVLFFYKKK